MDWNVEKIREEFPVLSRQVYGKPLAYLDNGATAQKPRCVIDKIDRMHREMNANVHRGAHYMSEVCTEEYEAARRAVADFIGAGSTREIVFTAGATASINTVAYSFGERFIGAGDNVITTEMEHHSNIVPWQLICGRKGAELRVIPFDDDGRLKIETLDQLIDNRTRIVCITQASNILGTCPDLKKVIETAHAAGVPVLVDGCQGVVHGGVNVQELDCDFYAFSGHKLYGPTGIGVLYGKERLLDEMPPFMGGGDMVGTVSFSGTTYAELPLKFEAGTPPFAEAVALKVALQYIKGIGFGQIEQHEKDLTRYTYHQLGEIPGLKIYGSEEERDDLISFNIEGAYHYDVGVLLDQMGIAVRTGHHCAQPLMRFLGVPGTVRCSFALYNRQHDADRLVEAVRKAAKMLL